MELAVKVNSVQKQVHFIHCMAMRVSVVQDNTIKQANEPFKNRRKKKNEAINIRIGYWPGSYLQNKYTEVQSTL